MGSRPAGWPKDSVEHKSRHGTVHDLPSRILRPRSKFFRTRTNRKSPGACCASNFATRKSSTVRSRRAGLVQRTPPCWRATASPGKIVFSCHNSGSEGGDKIGLLLEGPGRFAAALHPNILAPTSGTRRRKTRRLRCRPIPATMMRLSPPSPLISEPFAEETPHRQEP